MKRFLSSVKMLIAVATLLAASALPAVAQIYEGCDDSLVIIGSSGRVWDCYIDDADDEWCYYTCYSAS